MGCSETSLNLRKKSNRLPYLLDFEPEGMNFGQEGSSVNILGVVGNGDYAVGIAYRCFQNAVGVQQNGFHIHGAAGAADVLQEQFDILFFGHAQRYV